MPQPVDLDASLLASLSADELAGVDDDAFDAAVDAYIEVKRTVERAGLALSREASKRGAHARHGFRDTAAWFAALGGERRGAGAPRRRAAATLEATPTIGEAYAAGKISKAAANRRRRQAPTCPRRSCAISPRRPATTPVEQLGGQQQAKLAHGKGKPPKPSRTNISRGTERVHIDSDLDVEDGEVLDVAIHAAMERLKLPKDLPIAQRRAIALVSIGRYFLEHVDDPAMTRVGRPHLIAVVDIETLAAAEPGTARLASGTPIPAHSKLANCVRRRRESRDHARQERSARREKSDERTDGGHVESSGSRETSTALSPIVTLPHGPARSITTSTGDTAATQRSRTCGSSAGTTTSARTRGPTHELGRGVRGPVRRVVGAA